MARISKASKYAKQEAELDQAKLLESFKLTEALMRASVDSLPQFIPLTHQQTPGDIYKILINQWGRGAGKTWNGARLAIEHARKYGSDARICLIGPTLDDTRETCIYGKSGILSIAPKEFEINKSTLVGRHINGAYIRGMTAEKPERSRGPEWTHIWADEVGSWRYAETWDNLMMGLRLEPADGVNPTAHITTTPRTTKLLKRILKEEGVVITRASTLDNEANLSPDFIQYIYDQYGGTRLGRQELEGELLEDIEGALWLLNWIDDNRRENDRYGKTVVSLDPATTSNSTSDETGLCVASLGDDNETYILDSIGLRASPEQWARRAVQLYHEHEADCILAETNQGGDMVKAVIAQVDRNVPVKTVHAKKGKHLRAEPVATLYEQGRVHHVKRFDILEDQMVSFPVAHDHDDRLDAMVYAVSYLTSRVKQNIGDISLDGIDGLTTRSGWQLS